jgi:hypothetical protein
MNLERKKVCHIYQETEEPCQDPYRELLQPVLSVCQSSRWRARIKYGKGPTSYCQRPGQNLYFISRMLVPVNSMKSNG